MKNNILKVMGIFFVVIFVLTGCKTLSFNQAKSSKKIRIEVKGSDTMLKIGEDIASHYMKENKKSLVMITGGGSSKGIKALIDKEVDIAQASRKIKEKEIGSCKM